MRALLIKLKYLVKNLVILFWLVLVIISPNFLAILSKNFHIMTNISFQRLLLANPMNILIQIPNSVKNVLMVNLGILKQIVVLLIALMKKQINTAGLMVLALIVVLQKLREKFIDVFAVVWV